MVPDFVALYAVVIVLFSLIYFLFASDASDPLGGMLSNIAILAAVASSVRHIL
jgi:hypothetical protein